MVRLNTEGELSRGELCIRSDGDSVRIYSCIVDNVWNPTGEWDYDEEKRTIKSNKQNKCLTTNGSKLWLALCEENNQNQMWSWKETFAKL